MENLNDLDSVFDELSNVCKQLDEITAPLKQFSSLISNVSQPLQEIKEQIDKSQLVKSNSVVNILSRQALQFRQILYSDSFLHEINHARKILESINLVACDNFLSEKSISALFSSAASTLEQFSETELLSEDDYVTIDNFSDSESIFPDSIAIPVNSNNMLRIKTDHFLAILSIVIPIFFTIFWDCTKASTIDNSSIQDNYQLLEEQNNLLLEQNMLLQQILNSADTSNSSKAELIEFLKESLSDSDSVHDPIQ